MAPTVLLFPSDIQSVSLRFARSTIPKCVERTNVERKKNQKLKHFSDKMFKMWFMIINQIWNSFEKNNNHARSVYWVRMEIEPPKRRCALRCNIAMDYRNRHMISKSKWLCYLLVMADLNIIAITQEISRGSISTTTTTTVRFLGLKMLQLLNYFIERRKNSGHFHAPINEIVQIILIKYKIKLNKILNATKCIFFIFVLHISWNTLLTL